MAFRQGMVGLSERYPALVALLAQSVAGLLVVGAVVLAAQWSDWRANWLAAGLAQGLLAACFGQYAGLSRWWWWINLLFVPALLLANGVPLPSWVFLVGFVLLLSLNWNSFGERVPLYLTGPGSRIELAGLLESRSAAFSFIDLGCGPAGTLLWLARRFPQARFVGVETAPLPFFIAWLRCLGRSNCRVRYQNLWRTDLSGFDVAYCFLSPAPMAALWEKVRAELAEGAWLVSNTFDIPGVPPQRIIDLDDWRGSRLLLWRVPTRST